MMKVSVCRMCAWHAGAVGYPRNAFQTCPNHEKCTKVCGSRGGFLASIGHVLVKQSV